MGIQDLLGASAQLCNGVGLLITVLVYRRPHSGTVIYTKGETPLWEARDRKRHRLALAGFVILGAGFALQLTASLFDDQ